MQKIMFLIGVGVLIGGVILSGYGSLAAQDLFEMYLENLRDPARLVETAVNTGMGQSPFQVFEQQLLLMQLLQMIGLGTAIVGAIMLAYGLWVKKERR
jgi:hypothetical protein